ncbi:hypothetical protein GJAV_G00242500 [Gymnothorax javanicus]|nr:hypothetical protein GJAV_G00242500 [Gymnothorax javanicus]
MGLDIWLLVLAVLVGWSFQEVTNCTLTGRYIPGSLCNVSKNDTEVQKAVLTGTYTFNNQSNDEFLFKAWRIDDAKRQIVKGIKYILEVQISRTVCRKTASTDLNNCHFQPEGKLHQIFHCHFEVWAMPWLKLMTTTFFFCEP